MAKKSLKFTLLCACKNEEQDIHLSLESAIAQTYPRKEIIFVDDSTDRTKEIIRKYAHKRVILLDGPGKGCCQARNLAMKQATGDVIVFLTADTDLEPGYLEKIAPHYEKGYDYVMVESYSNLDTVYSRFVQADHLVTASKPDWNPLTTQGYSVRREAALDVGGISGGDYPVNFCRDWSLVKKMQERGYKGIIDRSIRVPHKSADNFEEYWRVQKTRGHWSAYQPYFLFFRSPTYLFFKFVAKSTFSFLEFVLIFPAISKVWKMAKALGHPFRNFFPLYYAYLLHILAYRIGEWQGSRYIWKYNRTHERPLLGSVIDHV
jgi:glycosyltransferase involved in cell wall biosynthesis